MSASKEEAFTDYSKWASDSDAKYVKELKFDVSKIEPQLTFDFKPDCVKDISDMVGTKIDQVYIGSCTNGRLEDLKIAASIIKGKKISKDLRVVLSPATPKIYKEALKAGYINDFMDAGICVTNPTCGACLGMSNGVLAENEVCASTTNRNFNGRMGKGGTVHLMSPATAAGTAIEGVVADPRKYL